MRNIAVGIFENVPVYGKKLAGYISGCDSSPFLVRLYLEHPAKLPEQELDVFIVSGALWPQYRELMRGMQVLVLDENGTISHEDGVRYAFKYQSAAAIYRTLLDLCMESGRWRIAASGGSGKHFEVKGILSPVRDEACEMQIQQYLTEAAAGSKLLCLCLAPVYTGPEPAAGSRPGSFSELIYYLKQDKQSLGSRISMMAAHGSYDLILPPATGGEPMELDAGEWQRLTEVLREETDYELVVLDFGSGVLWPAAAGCLKKVLIFRSQDPWEIKAAERLSASLDLMTAQTPFEVEVVSRGTRMKEEIA